MLTGWEQAAVFFGGLAAGAINTVVGAGSLIVFPLLLALGFPPVVANVTNKVGLVPGSISGSVGYRNELEGQRARLIKLASAVMAGALSGALLLLALPAAVFEGIVPLLIGGACVLVLVQPLLARRMERAATALGRREVTLPLLIGVFLCGLYGGYFGAAQGILFLGVLGVGLNETLQRINAAKNVLAALANLLPALVFVAIGEVRWPVVLLLGAGGLIGGVVGARVGRRLPAGVLRGCVLVVGLAAIVMVVTR